MGEGRRLKDELADILNEDPYEGVRDKCGLAAAINFNTASKHAIHLGWALNHRGDKGFGVSSVDNGQFHFLKKFGSFSQNIGPKFAYNTELPGTSAIAHARYPTQGFSEDYACLQPFRAGSSKFGPFNYAHNGQFVEGNIKEALLSAGVILSAESDTALFPHIMAQVNSHNIIEGIAHFMNTVPAAYSMLVQTPKQTIAFRDRHGVKPLHYAKMENGWLVASETDAFRSLIDAEYVEPIKPGEIVVFNHDTPNTTLPQKIQAVQDAPYMPCIFERIYFSQPRSFEEGIMHEQFRHACGEMLVRENQQLFEELRSHNAVIVPILDSGKHGAIGVQEESGLKYRELFMRRHNTPTVNGRSYTQSTDEERRRLAYAKLDLLEESVKGNWVVTVDDSLVRSTTATIFNERLNNAGAEHITNLVVSPQVRDICYLGMNHQDASKLAAHKFRTNEAIARNVGADEIAYLSLEGMSKLVKEIYNLDTFCAGCFGGKYPVVNR